MKSDNAKEVWKPIKDFEGIYAVSSFGRVFIHERLSKVKETKRQSVKISSYERKRSSKVASLSTDKAGYKMLVLRKNGKSTLFRVHRLVADAFLPKKKKHRLCVNHINGNKSDNRVVNLEWCSHQENIKHAIDNGLHKGINSATKKKLVNLLKKNQHRVIDIARMIGVSPKTVRNYRDKLPVVA